jgi:hypothetical protein
MALFLFILFFISLCLFFAEDKVSQPRITPDMLLSKKGKPLYGATLQARIEKLERAGYIL